MRRPAPFLLGLLLLGLPGCGRAQSPEAALTAPDGAPVLDGTEVAGRQALAALAAGRWLEADSVSLAADPLLRKYVTWARLISRNGNGTLAEVAAFAAGNPDWPAPHLLAARAEALAPGESDDAAVLAWYGAHAPRTLDGAQRFADALGRAGRGGEAAPMLREAWVEAAPDAAAEANFAARNGAVLTPDDEWRRFDRLGFAGRDQAAAARQAQRVDPARQPVALARVALAANRPDALTLAAAAPRGDLGLLLEQARWLRRNERAAEAAVLWQSEGPQSQAGLAGERARAVWTERQILARTLLRAGDYPTAYAVAAGHGVDEPGEARQEAEFLAGFLALRKLNDPGRALRHFAAIPAGSHSVITRARAEYWQGRAALAMNDREGADGHFEAAAALPYSYYGQLAALRLGEGGQRLAARIRDFPEPQPSAAESARFDREELARVSRLLGQLGAAGRAKPFLLQLEAMAGTPGTRVLPARLAVSIGRPDLGVWVSRRAGIAGVTLKDEGWPVPYALPVSSPEPALILGITRQESNFELEAVSSSGARGLMQLMPATAQHVAKQLGVPHQTGMLTTDAAHNMRLGAGYLDEMLARYNGAMPLAIAAYNAGPRRVDEWLIAFGDPRGTDPANPGPDMIDWIETIPFNETRNYVQRVLENVVIYRAREGGGATQDHPLAKFLTAGN